MSKVPSEPKPLNRRSIFVALCMVLLWTVGCCFMVAANPMRSQHLLMVIGFGAILTIFLLQLPLLFLISTVVIFASTGVYMFTGAGPEDQPVVLWGLLRALPVAAALIALAIWLWRRPLRRGELVIVYACVVIAIPWAICLRAVVESSAANLFEIQRESEPQTYAWARELPWWAPSIQPEPLPKIPPGKELAPEELAQRQAEHKRRSEEAEQLTRQIIKGFARGNGGKVAWRYWAKPILYWTGICMAWQAMLMGLLLLFRKRFIEHERLGFVWSQPAINLIRGPPSGRRPRSHWVLFAIGLAICLPSVIFVSPTGEPTTSWECPPWAGKESMEGIRAGVDLTKLNLLPQTTLRLWWGPLVLALFLLLPVDVLMTTALAHMLLAILLPGIMRSFGLTVGPERLERFVKNGLRFGGGVGLLFWYIWFNRRTIWGYIRSLWGGRPTNAESRDELGRKWIILMFVVGLIGFVVMGWHATNGVEMIILTLLILIFSFSQVRLRIAGLPLSYDSNFGSHQLTSIQRGILGTHFTIASQDPSVAVTGHGWATHWMQWGFNGQLKSFGPHNMLLEAFKVAHELRVHAREVAKAILTTMLVVAAVTPAMFIYLMHVYGFETNFTGGLSTWADFMQWSERASSYGMAATSSTLANLDMVSFYGRYEAFFDLACGVIIVGILFYLRREFPRFPFSPIGVVIAAEYFYNQQQMPFGADMVWFSFLILWIAKALIFRWLGVRSFREKIVPGVIMLLCGMIFGMMVFIFRHVGLLQGCMK